MATYTYYFALSVLAALYITLYLTNLYFFKRYKKLLTGQALKPGTPQYVIFLHRLNRRNINVLVSILPLVYANLAYSAYMLFNRDAQEQSLRAAIIIPIVCIAIVAGVYVWARYNHEKNSSHNEHE